ncbi:Fe2+-dependent dioxygenase [Aquabacterium sp. J223]|uniref:Fe2+-dependent dioxygenase n=1 Tax=Aquabacterium sp. J223 TaxID=2898431 RepID=UPI0021ADBD45|nr:Fe2+-dependent dioxygenase [Aquabacterium sp. J223]UUX96059.1 Fe2+-dependent dioxygenase [Aquabacterium sp. J223]
MILTLPLLTDDEVREARQRLDRARWIDGRATAGDQAEQVKRNEQLSGDDPAVHALQQLVLRAIDRSPQFLTAALPRKVFPPSFNRYGGDGNAYGPHVDSAIRFPQPGVRLRTDLSCTLFLSDPEAYDGGELVIQGPQERTSLKLPAGQAVLYPGTSVHEVRPVTRGLRLASFFWVESLVRSDEQRRLLYDMDMSLMRLRERHGETPEAVALTGTYHNLLRLWAET